LKKHPKTNNGKRKTRRRNLRKYPTTKNMNNQRIEV
jgi:hypothetical protein